jgi:hypothetical protein
MRYRWAPKKLSNMCALVGSVSLPSLPARASLVFRLFLLAQVWPHDELLTSSRESAHRPSCDHPSFSPRGGRPRPRYPHRRPARQEAASPSPTACALGGRTITALADKTCIGRLPPSPLARAHGRPSLPSPMARASEGRALAALADEPRTGRPPPSPPARAPGGCRRPCPR